MCIYTHTHTYIYITGLSNWRIFIRFKQMWTFTKTGHEWASKSSEISEDWIIKSTLSDYSAMNIEANNQKKSRNILLNKLWSQNK